VVTCARPEHEELLTGRAQDDGLAPVDVAVATGRHATGVGPQTDKRYDVLVLTETSRSTEKHSSAAAGRDRTLASATTS
jgi:hypothetical protein